jgi:hypothetical protein
MQAPNTKAALLDRFPQLPSSLIQDDQTPEYYEEIADKFGASAGEDINEKIDELIDAIDPFEEYDDYEDAVEYDGKSFTQHEFRVVKREKVANEIKRFHDAGVFETEEGRRELMQAIEFAGRNELTTFENKALTKLLSMAEGCYYLSGTTVTAMSTFRRPPRSFRRLYAISARS